MTLLAAPASSQTRVSADTVRAPEIEVPVMSQEPATLRVGRVSVQGNAAVDSARILRSFEVRSGEPYSEEPIRRGLRKLFALGLFDDIRIERVERLGESQVVDLVLHVRERPRLAGVEFSGNQKRETSELEKKLVLRAGDVYSPTAVASQLDTLQRYYRDEGFPQAHITATTDTTGHGGRVQVRFEVREGERVKIERVDFPGATAFEVKRLRKAVKSRAHWFLGGGDVKDENLAEDRERLERYYRSRGFREMRVAGAAFDSGSAPDRVVLRLTVEEGSRFRFGKVNWTGNHVLPAAELEKGWPKSRNDWYDVSRIEKAQGAAYAAYAEQGYLYLGIEPRETVRDSMVDLTFDVGEGKPSHVRYVVITGNKATREKVIRREVDLREGDRFRRSALVRTQGDIMRLGLFEDVGIDFTPADSFDVDIQLKVREKQVGTASAGAGYTSESGVTGFLELGHTNVLGNGQSLNLHLERGARREDYYLSFTEPWFKGTPTLLGFTAFNSERERDLYNERRVGASGRIGRPLPWPDYSRGSVLYRLESVEITSLGNTLNAADSIALQGVDVGDPVLTSSFELSFLRNSQDNPFYPTKGTRLSWTTELAGGPFGGSINFHKHRIEGKAFLPSVFKSFTTMVKARIGMVDQYADQNFSVPTYERFRLGGGTTQDPLRGYDDYQVVPGKFNRDVVIRNDTTFTDSTRTVVQSINPLTQRVRYPGGRYLLLLSTEQQFPIVHPLHGVLFFDAGNVWDERREIRPLDLKLGAGLGFRMEIPLLGNIGFDYGYGFDRDDGPRWAGHFLIGNVNF